MRKAPFIILELCLCLGHNDEFELRERKKRSYELEKGSEKKKNMVKKVEKKGKVKKAKGNDE